MQDEGEFWSSGKEFWRTVGMAMALVGDGVWCGNIGDEMCPQNSTDDMLSVSVTVTDPEVTNLTRKDLFSSVLGFIPWWWIGYIALVLCCTKAAYLITGM